MKISTRMSFALGAAGFAVFGLYGYHHLDTELTVRRQAAERQTLLLGRSLQLATEDALRDKQLDDIHDTINTLKHIDPTVDILTCVRAANAFTCSPSTTDPFELDVLRESGNTQQAVLRADDLEDPQRLVLGLPLHTPDGRLAGGLVVNRPLQYMQHDLAVTRRDIALSVIFFVVATSTLGQLMGHLYIGRPLALLASAMRRVRSGDLSSELDVASRDEISALSTEFNAMVRELRDARLKLQEESEKQRRLEQGLRQADKLITIGQLSTGLAHEIGTPLQILNGRARALLTRAHDPEAVKRNADILVSQTDRITRIIEQLLHFARRRPSRVSRIDLAASARAVVDLLEIEVRRRQVTLVMSAGDGPLLLEADPDQLQQVVLNLLNNALMATPPGGRIDVRLETGSFRAPDGTETPSIRLSVRDSGCGIPDEILEHLGEPFFTTRVHEGGTGLGLAVVKSVVTDHHGVMSVESTPGQGSRFTVDLPTLPAARAPAAQPQERSEHVT